MTVTGVTVMRNAPGISYLSVGYPGARADLLLDFDAEVLANDLKRIDPDVIVLAFGTNEGFDDNLDVDRYRDEYRRSSLSSPNTATCSRSSSSSRPMAAVPTLAAAMPAARPATPASTSRQS